MKALKTIGIILGLMIVIVLVLGLIAPKTVSTERSIVINAPRAVVFPHLQYFEKQQAWSPWNERDPNMKSEIVGTDGSVGAINRWESETQGIGEQEITALVPNERMETHLRFKGQGEADAFMAAADADGGTKVTWGFSSTSPYPMNVMNLFMDIAGMVGKDYEAGLSKLKTMIESTPKTYNGYQVQAVESPAKYFVALRETIAIDKVSEGYAKNLGKIVAAVQQAGIEMAGMPCGMFFRWDEAKGEADLAYAIPVATKAIVKGYETIEVPAGKLLVVDYYGAYAGTGEAHIAMDEYVKENNLEALVPVWEEYITDPGTQPDTAKWLTKVYYPIKGK